MLKYDSFKFEQEELNQCLVKNDKLFILGMCYNLKKIDRYPQVEVNRKINGFWHVSDSRIINGRLKLYIMWLHHWIVIAY